MAVKIPAGLRGNIYQTGKHSYRLQLSLGRQADGNYANKRETIRGTEQDAIDLLIRWNVQYLDNRIQATNYETVQMAYEEWIAEVERLRTPNTLRFYKQRFALAILPEIGPKRLKDVAMSDLKPIMAKYPNDQHNKRALRAFFNWCVDSGKMQQRFDYRKLETVSKPAPKRETDVWDIAQVQRVYSVLTFEPLYDIFIVLGIECGLRPQEICAVTWDKISDDHILIDTAVKERTPDAYTLGTTKTEQDRAVATTPYLLDKLAVHKSNQRRRIIRTAGYNRDANLIVADTMGNVPDGRYIRRYMHRVAKRAGVHPIPPKNLRSTYISLMSDIGVALPVIQKAAGHSSPDVTSHHYIRVFDTRLKAAAEIYHEHLHGAAGK